MGGAPLVGWGVVSTRAPVGRLAAVAPRPLRSGARPHTVIATGLAAALGLVLPAAAQAGPLSRALDNLAAHQDRFGGGFSVGGGTDPNDTAWATLAVTAAGERAERWRAGHASLRDAMARPLRKPMLGDIERTAVAAGAAGLDPRRTGGRNLMREVLTAQNADGSIGDGPSTTAWGILALRAGGLPADSFSVRRARSALEGRQREDGGWSADESPLGATRTPRRSPSRLSLRRGGGPSSRPRSAGRASSFAACRTPTAGSRRWWAARARPSRPRG